MGLLYWFNLDMITFLFLEGFSCILLKDIEPIKREEREN